MIELNLPAKQTYLQAILKHKKQYEGVKTMFFNNEEDLQLCLDLYDWHDRKYTKKKVGVFLEVTFD